MTEKRSKLPLFALLAGIAALTLAVVFIFNMIEAQTNKLDAVPQEYQVLDTDSGEASPYFFEVVAPVGEDIDYVRAWLEKCTGERGYYWLTHSGIKTWELYLYLPQMQALAGDIDRSKVTVRTENLGMHSVLHIYLSSAGTQTRDKLSAEQLLHFAAPKQLERPGAVRVYLDGELLESSGHCLYDHDQWNWFSN